MMFVGLAYPTRDVRSVGKGIRQGRHDRRASTVTGRQERPAAIVGYKACHRIQKAGGILARRALARCPLAAQFRVGQRVDGFPILGIDPADPAQIVELCQNGRAVRFVDHGAVSFDRVESWADMSPIVIVTDDEMNLTLCIPEGARRGIGHMRLDAGLLRPVEHGLHGARRRDGRGGQDLPPSALMSEDGKASRRQEHGDETSSRLLARECHHAAFSCAFSGFVITSTILVSTPFSTRNWRISRKVW